MNDKQKFPRALAIDAARDVCNALKPVTERLIVAGSLRRGKALVGDAARDVCNALKPVTERLIVAGSLRRGKALVGDAEILFIPKFETRPDGLFDTKQVNLADEALQGLLDQGVLKHRPNKLGSNVWGAKNKLAVHVATGVPVDLFSVLPVRCPCATIPHEPKSKTVLREIKCPICNGTGWHAPSWWNYLVCRTGPGESNIRICEAAQRKGWKWNPYGAGFSSLAGNESHPVLSEEDVFKFVGLAYLPPEQRR